MRPRKSKLLPTRGGILETLTVRGKLMREGAGFGRSRPLHGFQHGDEITLAIASTEDIGAPWATRREPPARAVPLLQHLEPAA